MQFPTGGIAHEPKGMTWCDSGADSIVWMEEDRVLRGTYIPARMKLLWNAIIPEFFFFAAGSSLFSHAMMP